MMEIKSNSLLRVALVGRPNVGKSSLFNYLTRSRKALVKNIPGVTRDIKKGQALWWGHQFEVWDTGGVTQNAEDVFEMVKDQVMEVLNKVDLIILMLDGPTGPMPDDSFLIQLIKKTNKPYKIVVNKLDRIENDEYQINEFYSLGEDFMPIAVQTSNSVDELIEWIGDHRTGGEYEFPDENTKIDEPIRLSVLGKPNVGKSSLVNWILGENKQIVFDEPGTTLDAIDHPFEFEGKKYILTDTAGLRKKAMAEDLESLGGIQAMKALNSSDIIVLIVDVVHGPTKQDAQIIEQAIDSHKAILIVGNKVDLAFELDPNFKDRFRKQIAKTFHFFKDVRVCFISALTGKGVYPMLREVHNIWNDLNLRIPTSKLNKFFTEVIRKAPAPVWGTENVKFYYLTQTRQRPPSFIAFANHPKGVTPSYRRFLSKQIQKNWNILGIPVRIFIMKSGKK